MRTPLLLFFFLFLSVTVKSQIPANAIAPEDAAFNKTFASRGIPKVTGKLLNMTAEEMKNQSIIYTLVTPFSALQITKTTNVQPDGSFKLDLDYPFPYQQIWFTVGDYFYAGLYANKDLYLELDMKKLKAKKGYMVGDGVSYWGTDGPMNAYMNKYVIYEKQEKENLSSKMKKLFSSQAAVDSLMPAFDKLYDSVKKIESSYTAANPSNYSWLLENERLSEYYTNICGKYAGKTMNDTFWQKIKQHKSFLVSNNSTDFYRYLSSYVGYRPGPSVVWKNMAIQPGINTSDKLLIDSLINFGKMQNSERWFNGLQQKTKDMVFLNFFDQSIQRIDNSFSHSKADFMKLALNTSHDVNEQKVRQEHILKSIQTAWCITVTKKEQKQIADKIAEINKTLANSKGGSKNTNLGTPIIETSFGATMYKASGIKTLDLLTRLKQNFPGKAIIIDRWATWCLPCLDEMPHSKKLEEESKDLPVVFVYLCTLNSSSESKWKSKVVEMQQPGVHILIDEKLDAEISSYFSFSGYPGYAFIDKAGNYKPGAFQRITNIENREALATLINK